MPEATRLAVTIEKWWPEIERLLALGERPYAAEDGLVTRRNIAVRGL